MILSPQYRTCSLDKRNKELKNKSSEETSTSGMDCNKITRLLFSSCGLALSLYAYYVTQNVIHNRESYTAYCDLNQKVSCTKLFFSRYGNGFGIMQYIFGQDSWINLSNFIAWSALYMLTILLNIISPIGRRVELLTAVHGIMCTLSVWNVYALYQLKNICMVSVVMYVINFLSFFLSFKRYNEIESLRKFKMEWKLYLYN